MIRRATQHDIADLRELWQMVFDDSGQFLDRFFAHLFKPDDCFVVESEGGRITSMLFLLEATASYLQENRSLRYIYACATHPDYRKKGLMGCLLNAAIECAGKKAFDLILVPANQSLFDYYKRFGFKQEIYHFFSSFPPLSTASATSAWEVSDVSDINDTVALLQRLRSDFLMKKDAILWPYAHMKVVIEELLSQKGEVLVMKTGIQSPLGYALTLPHDNGTVEIIECVSQSSQEEMVASLRMHYKDAKTTFSLPGKTCQSCIKKPFGLLYSKENNAPLYFNLALNE